MTRLIVVFVNQVDLVDRGLSRCTEGDDSWLFLHCRGLIQSGCFDSVVVVASEKNFSSVKISLKNLSEVKVLSQEQTEFNYNFDRFKWNLFYSDAWSYDVDLHVTLHLAKMHGASIVAAHAGFGIVPDVAQLNQAIVEIENGFLDSSCVKSAFGCGPFVFRTESLEAELLRGKGGDHSWKRILNWWSKGRFHYFGDSHSVRDFRPSLSWNSKILERKTEIFSNKKILADNISQNPPAVGPPVYRKQLNLDSPTVLPTNNNPPVSVLLSYSEFQNISDVQFLRDSGCHLTLLVDEYELESGFHLGAVKPDTIRLKMDFERGLMLFTPTRRDLFASWIRAIQKEKILVGLELIPSLLKPFDILQACSRLKRVTTWSLCWRQGVWDSDENLLDYFFFSKAHSV